MNVQDVRVRTYDFTVSRIDGAFSTVSQKTRYRLSLTFITKKNKEDGLALEDLEEIAAFLTAYVEKEKGGGAR